MFQKQTFGSNTTGFGAFNSAATTSSPFGSFKPPTAGSTFGAAPAFGASTSTQPATGGGLFGSSNTSTGLFGSTPAAAPAPAFGTSNSFSFGGNTSGGLFNNANTPASGGLFGNNSFAKPAGFGFGSTTTTGTTGGGLFGSTPSTSTGLFGQQTNTLGGGGLFSTGSTFGQQSATGTARAKYNPVVGTDVVVKSGNSQTINIKHHCITCMKEYEGKSLEELRLEDYTAGRKGASGGGMFGGFQQPAENKPLFGGSTFGQPATTSTPSLFGSSLGSTGGFGQTNTFSFGNNTQSNTNTTGLFGAAKPTFGSTTTAGTGLFGATTTQTPTFGTNTSTFGFGSNTQNQSGGLFGSTPATSAFGSTASTTGFGAFGGGGLFAKPQQTTAPTFPSATPFGSASTGFGTNTTSTSLFGGSTFGKPAATQQPAFGFNTQPTLGTGLGGTNNTFQARGTAPAFGLSTGSSMFSQPQQTGAFGTNTSLGGSSLFGTTPSLGTSLGMGQLNTNNMAMPGTLQGAPGTGVHEQILNLAARPYGDSPLFKDLVPDTSNAKDIMKPTNPAAVKAVLESSNSAAYRVTSPTAGRLKVHPRAPVVSNDKKSLFDGLEESDASLEDKLSLKPSRKRLVLRPHHSRSEDSDVNTSNNNNRSLEDQPRQEMNGGRDKDVCDAASQGKQSRELPSRQSLNDINANNFDVSADRHGSWLGSQKMPWSRDKEKQIDEPTPGLYPNLDKELPEQISERRASWLTTKPLRKPLVSNPEAVENSVRELGVRSDRSSHDKENIDSLSVSEEENVSTREAPPHPAGVKLTRPGYYTIPSLEEMTNYLKPDGTCVVPHLTIGRKNYGNVFYDCEVDVAGLDLDALVHFLNKEVIVYPEDADKPPVGCGLNRRAVVTLDRVWPRDKAERRPITEPDRLLKMDYEGKLRRACDKHDTKFIEYRPQTGSWVFRVEHFSKYGLTDSDEEDDPTPDVLKRQLANQNLQKSAAPAPKQSVTVPGLAPAGLNSSGLGGLNASGAGLGGLGGPDLSSDQLFGMQHASLTCLSLMNGGSKAYEMDTTEDNAEAHSLYQDNRAFGVKSPTSELARLEHRQSHNVQLMKASLYADTEMEEEMSLSSGDQLVPAARMSSAAARARHSPAPPHSELVPSPARTEEIIMRPLIVTPHTIVLKYHRKVPPFKHTIAGKLGAACIADMSVCRARHSRAGFAPGGALAFATSYDSIAHLPNSAELSSLSKYVRGRGEDDWSECVVARIAIGQQAQGVQDTLEQQLESLLEYSTFIDPPANLSEQAREAWCPRLQVEDEPARRLRLLQSFVRNAEGGRYSPEFGVSSDYCLEVWKLCDALWSADLENDGIPGTDMQSVVHRHKRLLEWLREVVAADTDKELARTTVAEEEDETDGHSARVWTLLLGGRVLEACRVAREHGDLNMAAIIAQAGGDPSFRNLLERQLHIWQHCGADSLISSHKRAALQLLAGLRPVELHDVPWTVALRATARYLCPQVPTLESVIRTYSSWFSPEARDDELDLTTLPTDEATMQYPLPPYAKDYTRNVDENNKHRRVLDLRYELIRARAFNTRPKLCPESYTPDPLDYSLCFLLGCWLGSPSRESVVGVADQLENRGQWHLAVQALAYHPDDVARNHLIRRVVSRHAPSTASSPEVRNRFSLLQKLRVPRALLLLAQAHRAKSEHQPALEVEYLVGAEQWNAAHKVLIEELLPEAVLADNLQSIRATLDKMSAAAERHELSGWETGGQALHHYLYVCDEILGLSQQPAGAVSARLEALRPRLAAACLALRGISPKTPRHAAARAEMGARLVQLALAGGSPPKHLAALLKALQLPPDCTALATHKITTDLAEQASEMCIETSSVSPSSSRLRATVHS